LSDQNILYSALQAIMNELRSRSR